MKFRTAVLGFLMSICALVQAAGEPKKPVLLQARDAKIANGMPRYSATGYGGVSIGGLVDKTTYVDFDLKLEPGKYRLIVSLVPLGGGYLLAKVDDVQVVRRSIPKSMAYAYKPQELRFGEIDIPEGATKLRFTAENVTQSSLGYFFQAELLWVAPLPPGSQVKSPLQQLAEKEKALKQAKAAKEGGEGGEGGGAAPAGPPAGGAAGGGRLQGRIVAAAHEGQPAQLKRGSRVGGVSGGGVEVLQSAKDGCV